jgi:uncharacterized membrane protein YfcA
MIEAFLSGYEPLLALAGLVGFLGGLIYGFAGFGGGLLMVPLYALFYGPVEAVAVAAACGFFASLKLYAEAARKVDWRGVAPVCAAILAGTPTGAWLLFHLDALLVRRIIGVAVIGAAVLLATGWVYRGRRGIVAAAATGGTVGVLTGLAGAGAPLLAVYFLATPRSIDAQRADIVIATVVVLVVLTASLVLGGGIDWTTVGRIAALAPVHVLGAWSGAHLFGRASETLFRRAAIALVMASGVVAILA